LQLVAREVLENDPKKLRARIVDLERLTKMRMEPAAVQVEKPVISETDLDRLDKWISDLKETTKEVDRIITHAMQLSRLPQPDPRAVGPMGPPMLLVDPRTMQLSGNALVSIDRDASIGKSGLRRMLTALAQNPAGLSDSKLGLRADVSVKGGSFDTYLSKGKKSGWIEGDRANLRITRAGLDALGPFDPLPTGRRLLDFWLGKLGAGGASRMLDVLSRFYPKSLTAAELGNHSNISVDGGSFDTYLSRLRGFDLISGSRSALKASEEFFK
jgi:hypothetical protein